MHTKQKYNATAKVRLEVRRIRKQFDSVTFLFYPVVGVRKL